MNRERHSRVDDARPCLRALVIAVFVQLALLGPARGAQDSDAEERARAELARAEEQASRGAYADAHSLYQRIAHKYPGTEAGATAERRSGPSAFLGWADLVRTGPSANRVDVVIMADGYTLEHQKAFDKLAADVPPVLLRVEPFREYARYLNFLRANLLSAEDGIDGFGREHDTALGGKTLDTNAGHVGLERGKARAMLDELPEHDGLAIAFVKQGLLGTGGGGIAVIGGRNMKTVVHEFGHAFGRLGDEYSNAQSSHQGAVGERPNVSSSDDPKRVPWAHWIAAEVPGIGVYGGAAARLKGAWKPSASGCVMASSDQFCPVCREALVLAIYRRVDPIESCDPPAQPQGVKEPYRTEKGAREFAVRVMQPATHALEVTWWVLPESRFAKTGEGASRWDDAGTKGPSDRAKRGPLQAFSERPDKLSRSNPSGSHKLRLSQSDLEPGVYRVICRVRDTTEFPEERFPWVLSDEAQLLASERAWWLEIPAR